MSLEKKSLISNRKVLKKANVVKADKPQVAKIAAPRAAVNFHLSTSVLGPSRIKH
jgi:hypothetical protein